MPDFQPGGTSTGEGRLEERFRLGESTEVADERAGSHERGRYAVWRAERDASPSLDRRLVMTGGVFAEA